MSPKSGQTSKTKSSRGGPPPLEDGEPGSRRRVREEVNLPLGRGGSVTGYRMLGWLDGSIAK